MASAGPLRWFKDWFSGVEEDEELMDPVEPTPTPSSSTAAPAATPTPQQRRRGALMLQERNEGGVEIRHPRSLEDRMAVGLDLKQRRMVMLDLTKMPESDSGYFLEFIYGVVYALDATIEKVTEGIYLLAPRGVSIHNDSETTGASTFSPRAGSESTSSLLTPRTTTREGGQEELFWQGR